MKTEYMTECEQLVMKCVWSRTEDLTLPEVVAMVNERFERNWAPQTVSTFLKRLVNKNFLKMYRRGRQFFYQPMITEKEYGGQIIEDCVNFWSNGNAGDMLSALNDRRELTKDELAKIQTLINDLSK